MGRYNIFFLLLLSCSLSAQFYDNHWMMGYFGGNQTPPDDTFGISILSFYEAELKIKNDQSINLDFDGSGNSFSNYWGDLIMYSNSLEIRDSSDQVIPNGVFEENGFPEEVRPQTFVFLPFEQVNLVQYLQMRYTNDFPRLGGDLYTSFITIDTNIALYQEMPYFPLDSLSGGGLTACRHANGRDWWVLIASADKPQVYSILLEPYGAKLVDSMEVAFPMRNGLGQSKFSPDGNTYVRFNLVTIGGEDYLDIFDFDRCTGQLSNHRQMNVSEDAPVSGGVAISPSSQYLYVSYFNYIFQYDLWEEDISASQDTVAVYDGYSQWNIFRSQFYLSHLAPDGKIYVNAQSGLDKLGVIEFPDRAGLACDVRQHSINLPNYNAFTLANHPHYRLGPVDGSICDSLGVDNLPRAYFRVDRNPADTLDFHFQNLSFYEPTTWSWSFGDGSGGDDFHAAHTYTEPDIYEVCLTVSNALGTDTYCRTLELGPSTLSEAALQNISITTFPNPTSDVLVVDLGNYLPLNGQFVLRDALGREVLRKQLLYRQARLDLSGLATGLYYYDFRDGGQLLGQGKVVVER